MSVAAHISNLNSKKATLEDEITFEMKRPLPDFMKISRLKKLKLAIKTEIEAILKSRKTA